MKNAILTFILIFPFLIFSQNDNLTQYQKGLDFNATNKSDSAYHLFKKLETNVLKSDSLYQYIISNKVIALTELEKEARMAENFQKSIEYGMEALDGIQKGKGTYTKDFLKREYFLTRNIVVSYFGLGDFEEGKNWKEKLYKAKKAGVLPAGIDKYFNFDYFKVGDLNVYGYEWYDAYPTSPYDKSDFTKVIYYVYTSNSDGTVKDQLYRFNVTKFNGTARNMDYVLTKKSGSGPDETSVTLYAYPYVKNIDYKKLQDDVREIASGNIKNYFKDNRKL